MSLAIQYNPNRSTGTVPPLHGVKLAGRRQFVPLLSHHSKSTQQALHTTLDLLTVAEEYMDRYTRLHSAETTYSPAERGETEESVAWMRSSLNDITATLIGIATHPVT